MGSILSPDTSTVEIDRTETDIASNNGLSRSARRSVASISTSGGMFDSDRRHLHSRVVTSLVNDVASLEQQQQFDMPQRSESFENIDADSIPDCVNGTNAKASKAMIVMNFLKLPINHLSFSVVSYNELRAQKCPKTVHFCWLPFGCKSLVQLRE